MDAFLNISLVNPTVSYRGGYATEYDKILSFLKRRGWRITKDPDIEANYKILSPSHRWGIKNGLELKAEKYPAGFKFEFYQNEFYENSNGGYYDFDKYEKMPYRLKLTYQNEVLRLGKFCKKIGMNVKISKKLSTVQEILEKEATNTHIHGGARTLEEIGEYLEKHPQPYNSSDADKKLLVCGQTKYFYDHTTKRLSRGTVYHNINNMWWVLVNGERYNIVCWDLFDFSPAFPRRLKKTDEQQLNILKGVLANCAERMEYEKCIRIREKIKRLTNEPLYNVWSLKWDAWWRPNNNGYTQDKAKAGVYLESNVSKHQDYYNNGVTNKLVALTQ